jgi:fumarate reductase flavoprotein subunit
VIDVLIAACHRAGVEIAMGNRATALLVAGGQVYGVEAGGEQPSASAVVLASGGFARNEELLARYYPHFAAQDGHWSPAPDSNVGDGLLMGREIGAAIVGGQRFINESAPYSVMSHAAGRQAGGVWNVFDERTRREGPASRNPLTHTGVWTAEAIADAVRRGIIVCADTLAELACASGIDAENLAVSVARYNNDCANGVDPGFGKDAAVMRPIVEPPFYAVRMRPLAMSLTAHGVQIDADANVLDTLGRPIPGLLAAGEVIGNLIGEQYLGGGNAVGGALTFGRIAGLRAAALAGNQR